MTSKGFHEDAATLSDATRELHRGIASLIEELEAIDWYQQRVDATGDEEGDAAPRAGPLPPLPFPPPAPLPPSVSFSSRFVRSPVEKR